MSKDFRLKNTFALSKLVLIPFIFPLICFTYLSSLVFKLSKSVQKSVHTVFTISCIQSIEKLKTIIQAKWVVQQAAFWHYLGGA